MQKRNKKLEKAILRLFKSRRTYDNARKANVPSLILEHAEKLYKSALDHIREFNIDGEEFLGSTFGATCFLEYCVDEEQLEKISARCGRCSFFTMKDKREPKHDCEIYGDESVERVICDEFDDTGESLDQRLLNLAIDRCYKCENVKLPKKKEYWFTDDVCLKGKDRIALKCSDFSEKGLTK